MAAAVTCPTCWLPIHPRGDACPICRAPLPDALCQPAYDEPRPSRRRREPPPPKPLSIILVFGLAVVVAVSLACAGLALFGAAMGVVKR